MEQISDYPRMLLVDDFDRAKVLKTPVPEAIKLVASKLFNVREFKVENG